MTQVKWRDAQVRKRKWTLERSRFAAEYDGIFDAESSILVLSALRGFFGGFVRLMKYMDDDVVIMFLAHRKYYQSATREKVSRIRWYHHVMPPEWCFDTDDFETALYTHDEKLRKEGEVLWSSYGQTVVYLSTIQLAGWEPGHLELAIIDHCVDGQSAAVEEQEEEEEEEDDHDNDHGDARSDIANAPDTEYYNA